MSGTDDRRPLAFVLDDDKAVATVVSKQLAMLGMEAWQFNEPNKFFVSLKVARPKLVVLDLGLGKSDAVEVLQQLDEVKYQGKILLISGRDQHTLDEVEKVGRHRGLHMLPALQKPFRALDLKRRCEQESELEAAPASSKPSPPRAKPSIDLAEAIRQGWLQLWYQPKINLKSLTVGGAEALIRANHPQHGLLAPADFLPPAGDPLYRPLSSFVLGRAMQDWQLFARQGYPLKIAINVPASVIGATGFVEEVRKAIPHDEGFPGLLVEMTEDEFIANPRGIAEVIAQLTIYKTTISIDDFGTAHASLSRVKDIPFTELKLDRSFVQGCASDPIKYGLCQTVADLAHRFQATTCAEGIETIDDLKCLLNLGFDTGQGFLFGKPQPLAGFLKFISSQKFEALPSFQSRHAG